MPYPKYETLLVRGASVFSRSAYAVILCLRDRFDRPYRHHVETFYGQDGRKVRAEAMRYAKAAREGKICLSGFRDDHVPSNFYQPPQGWPPADRA